MNSESFFNHSDLCTCMSMSLGARDRLSTEQVVRCHIEFICVGVDTG